MILHQVNPSRTRVEPEKEIAPHWCNLAAEAPYPRDSPRNESFPANGR